MSLALVKLTQNDFNLIYSHVLNYKPNHQNIHLREAKIVNGKRTLRYLHAMKADNSRAAIDGVISGPGMYCEYSISVNSKGRVQMNVLSQVASSKELTRLAQRFTIEVLNRVHYEKNNSGSNHARYKKGEFYLKRANPGMSISHKNCQKAISLNPLDVNFLNKLASWNFRLLNP